METPSKNHSFTFHVAEGLLNAVEEAPTRENCTLVIGSWLVYELSLLAVLIYLGGWFYSIVILSEMLVPKLHV